MGKAIRAECRCRGRGQPYQGMPVVSCTPVSSAWKPELKMFQPESCQAVSSASDSAWLTADRICEGSTPGPELIGATGETAAGTAADWCQ